MGATAATLAWRTPALTVTSRDRTRAAADGRFTPPLRWPVMDRDVCIPSRYAPLDGMCIVLGGVLKGVGPSSPNLFRVSACVAHALKATVQYRVTLSLR